MPGQKLSTEPQDVARLGGLGIGSGSLKGGDAGLEVPDEGASDRVG